MTALLRRPEAVPLALLVVALAVGGVLSPGFLDAGFILQSATLYVEVGLIALALTLLMVAGEIDLSVASMTALCACVFGLAVEAGLPLPLAIAASLGAGLLLGLFNALLVVGLGLPSLITTIGTLTLFRGLAQALLGDRSITRLPESWIGLDAVAPAGVPAPVLILVAAAALAALVLHATVFGRRVVLIGVNAEAARRVGAPVRAVKVALFAASGLVCAAAGLMMSSRLGVVRYDLAAGGELQAVLIAILGGVAVAGGRGSIGGVFVAFWLMVAVQTALTVANVAVERQLAVLGLMLLAAVAAGAIRPRDLIKGRMPWAR